MPVIKLPPTEMMVTQINIVDGDERTRMYYFQTSKEALEFWKTVHETIEDDCWRFADCEIFSDDGLMGSYEDN